MGQDRMRFSYLRHVKKKCVEGGRRGLVLAFKCVHSKWTRISRLALSGCWEVKRPPPPSSYLSQPHASPPPSDLEMIFEPLPRS